MESLGIGGAEKSLVTVLSLFNFDQYDVDLFLFNHNGEFMQYIPQNVNVLPFDNNTKQFIGHFKTAFFRYIMKGDIKRSFHSTLWLLKCIFHRVITKKEYVGWEHMKNIFTNIQENYNIAIGFLEKKSIYYVVDKAKADKKIGVIHTDYSQIEHDLITDQRYFKFLDKIFAVSDHSRDVLIEIFPLYKNKFNVMKNMIPFNLIQEMASKTIEIYKCREETLLVTVGRLVPAKGIDNAVLVCQQLIKHGLNIKWYIIGDGPERKTIEVMVKKYGLNDKFILLGSQINPYKYINIADIYVQPSKYEGYGITIAEAKVLSKPIVATAIPEFKEQIKHLKTGLLCRTISDMTLSIEELIKDDDLRKMLSDNLKQENSISNNMKEDRFQSLIENN